MGVAKLTKHREAAFSWRVTPRNVFYTARCYGWLNRLADWSTWRTVTIELRSHLLLRWLEGAEAMRGLALKLWRTEKSISLGFGYRPVAHSCGRKWPWLAEHTSWRANISEHTCKWFAHTR